MTFGDFNQVQSPTKRMKLDEDDEDYQPPQIKN